MAATMNRDESTLLIPAHRSFERTNPVDGFHSEPASEAPLSVDALKKALGGTRSQISKDEVGDEEETDRSVTSDLDAALAFSKQKLAERVIVAQNLRNLASRLLKSRGSVKMAADLQLLKRGLADVYSAFGSVQSESNFVSIVAQIETSLMSMDWKKASESQIRIIVQSLELASVDRPLEFGTLSKVSRQIRGEGIPTLPVFDLDGENTNDSQG